MTRLALTRTLIKQLDQDTDLDAALSEWWWDVRPAGGLRLTDSGFAVFANQMHLAHWHFDMPDSILTPRNLLMLDRYLTCPYYLKKQRRQHSLILFGDRESMMASVYGDIERFIGSLQP